jgi:hypothetical protein
VSIYSDKKIAPELPPNFEISAAIFCRRIFIKIARTESMAGTGTLSYWVIPENIHTTPTEEIGN